MGKPISLILEAPEERLPAQAFLVGIRSFLGLLRDLDVAVSKDPRGTVNWEITGLSMASPAQISCSGSSRLKGIDYTPVIESHIIRGIRLLSERDRDPLYSESALKWTRQLANLRKKGLEYVGVMA